MNQILTTPSNGILKTAKFVLSRCIPLVAASLFTSAAFAAPDAVSYNRCPDNDFIYNNYETKFHWIPGQRADSDRYISTNKGYDWKLSVNDIGNVRTAEQHPLKLFKVKVKMMTESPYEANIERVECYYRNAENPNAPIITMALQNYSYLYSDEFIRGSVEGADTLGYVLNAGMIDKTELWGDKQPGDNLHQSCPINDPYGQPGNVDQCTFEYKKDYQRNGYWEDAGWRCGSYAECSKRRRAIRSFVKDFTQGSFGGCRVGNKKEGAIQYTCQDAIKHVNTLVHEMGYWNSGGKAWPWTTCWYQKNFPKTFQWTRANSKAEETLQGSYNWVFGYDDHNGDNHRARACHRYTNSQGVLQPLNEYWPRYQALGYKFIK